MNIQQADNGPWAKLVPLYPGKELENLEDGLIMVEEAGNWRIERKPTGETWITNLSASFLKVDSHWLEANQEKQLFGGERLAFRVESKEESSNFDYVFCLVDLPSKNKIKRNREDESSGEAFNQKPPEKLLKVDNSIQEAEITCSICLEILTRCATLGPRGHNFCASCLISHLKNSSSCPLCNKRIGSVIKNSALCNIIEATVKNFPHLQRSSNEGIIPLQKDLEGNIYVNESGVFIGSVINEKKEGQGTYVYADGQINQCVWKNDLKEGEGIFILKSGTSVKGLWSRDCLQPHAEIKFANGDFYKGETKFIQPGLSIRHILHGRGILKLKNGQTYKGYFRDGLKEGFGKYSYIKGHEYEGDWKQGGREGFGTMKYSDGAVYKGAWKNNQREGHGIFIMKNGDKFEGTFRNHYRNGIGKCTWANGEEYEGNYTHNLRNGNGTMKFLDGSIFKGMWEKDQEHGKGVLILKDGDKIEGYWINGNLQPLVIIEYANGDIYEGEIHTETFQKHGKGVLFLKNGGWYHGYWTGDTVDGVMDNFLWNMMIASMKNFDEMAAIYFNLWRWNQVSRNLTGSQTS